MPPNAVNALAVALTVGPALFGAYAFVYVELCRYASRVRRKADEVDYPEG